MANNLFSVSKSAHNLVLILHNASNVHERGQRSDEVI